MTQTVLEYVALSTNPGWTKFALQIYGAEPFAATRSAYAPKDNFTKTIWREGPVRLLARTAPADPNSLRGPLTVASVSGRKPANPDRAPDFWTNPSMHPLVSEAAKTFIERTDPGNHSFHPAQVVHQKTKDPFGDKQYFYWVLGRGVTAEKAASPLPNDAYVTGDAYGTESTVVAPFLQTLAETPAAIDKISDLPFWCLLPWDKPLIRPDVADAARAAGLTGLEASSFSSSSGTPTTLRHTTRIGITAQPKSKGLLRRLFS